MAAHKKPLFRPRVNCGVSDSAALPGKRAKPEGGPAGMPAALGFALDGWQSRRQPRPMPRTMRVEYPGAVYHVVNRGAAGRTSLWMLLITRAT